MKTKEMKGITLVGVSCYDSSFANTCGSKHKLGSRKQWYYK